MVKSPNNVPYRKYQIMKTDKNIVFKASARDFEKIPESPIAYWVSHNFRKLFNAITVADISSPRRTLQPGNVPRFTRFWYEVSRLRIALPLNHQCSRKWFPMSSGGEQRKWYGNLEVVVNWENNGAEIKAFEKSIIPSEDKYFQEAIGWSRISTGDIMMRYYPKNLLHGDATGCIFDTGEKTYFLLAFFNSPISTELLKIINPTITFTRGSIASVPIQQISLQGKEISLITSRCILLSRADWNQYETSWDFERSPLLAASQPHVALSEVFDKVRRDWIEATSELHRLEEENNRIFIEAYGLQDELTPEVPWNEITLTCNPWYRYGVTPPNPACKEFPVDDALEARMKADTMKEFLSYAVG